ncbi:MAG: HD-GYP domain-containing protein [Chloroflexota bacterium]
MENALLKSLLILADIVEARDPYTGGHIWRVSQFAKLLAVKAGLNEAEAIQISLGGYLHDLGKIGIPDAILLKPGKLTGQEFEIIKTHPLIGKKIIAEHPLSGLVCKPIVEHHERLDGTGYPNELVEDQIALESRIVGISDALDAMTSTRPYRKGLPQETALIFLEQGIGKQFDPMLVGHICDLGRAGDLRHIIGHSAEGIPLVTCPTCGPIVAVPRTARDGDVVFCRACTGMLALHKDGASFEAELTGMAGSAFDLQAHPNFAAIEDMLNQIPGTVKV